MTRTRGLSFVRDGLHSRLQDQRRSAGSVPGPLEARKRAHRRRFVAQSPIDLPLPTVSELAGLLCQTLIPNNRFPKPITAPQWLAPTPPPTRPFLSRLSQCETLQEIIALASAYPGVLKHSRLMFRQLLKYNPPLCHLLDFLDHPLLDSPRADNLHLLLLQQRHRGLRSTDYTELASWIRRQERLTEDRITALAEHIWRLGCVAKQPQIDLVTWALYEHLCRADISHLSNDALRSAVASMSRLPSFHRAQCLNVILRRKPRMLRVTAQFVYFACQSGHNPHFSILADSLQPAETTELVRNVAALCIKEPTTYRQWLQFMEGSDHLAECLQTHLDWSLPSHFSGLQPVTIVLFWLAQYDRTPSAASIVSRIARAVSRHSGAAAQLPNLLSLLRSLGFAKINGEILGELQKIYCAASASLVHEYLASTNQEDLRYDLDIFLADRRLTAHECGRMFELLAETPRLSPLKLWELVVSRQKYHNCRRSRSAIAHLYGRMAAKFAARADIPLRERFRRVYECSRMHRSQRLGPLDVELMRAIARVGLVLPLQEGRVVSRARRQWVYSLCQDDKFAELTEPWAQLILRRVHHGAR